MHQKAPRYPLLGVCELQKVCEFKSTFEKILTRKGNASFEKMLVAVLLAWPRGGFALINVPLFRRKAFRAIAHTRLDHSSYYMGRSQFREPSGLASDDNERSITGPHDQGVDISPHPHMSNTPP